MLNITMKYDMDNYHNPICTRTSYFLYVSVLVVLLMDKYKQDQFIDTLNEYNLKWIISGWIRIAFSYILVDMPCQQHITTELLQFFDTTYSNTS